MKNYTSTVAPEKSIMQIEQLLIKAKAQSIAKVFDPFSGSGTTARVAQRHGRQFIALDVRQSQCELTLKRLAEPEKAPKKSKSVKPLPSQGSLFS